MSKRLLLIIILLFFAAWLPRVLALDATVTADEPKWLAASAKFYQAISQGDFVHTAQKEGNDALPAEHPGVTVLWAGLLGILVTDREGYLSYAQEAAARRRVGIDAWLGENSSLTPLELLVAGRWWMVFFISLTLALSYLPLRRLLGERVALLAVGFVLWDPFHIALSRQLHPEGLAAALCFLALTTFLVWLYDNRGERHASFGARHYLISSAIAMGLAWLTKSPTILLVPVAALLVALEWRSRPLAHSPPRPFAPSPPRPLAPSPPSKEGCLSRRPLALMAWGLLSLFIFVLLWPAMWVDPLGVLGKMATETSIHIREHLNGNYFFGRATPDPGPVFYPVAYLFRTTPLILIGLAAAYLLLWRRATHSKATHYLVSCPKPLLARQTAAALVTFAFFFTLMMTLAANKFDRYLLPIFLPLDVVAALGWVALSEWTPRETRFFRRERGSAPLTLPFRPLAQESPSPLALLPLDVVAALGWVALGSRMREGGRYILMIVLLFHALLGFRHYPYYLTYYNPLLGGSVTAPKALLVGWGEGLDQAAAWLNEQGAYGNDAISASTHGESPTRPLLSARVVPKEAYPPRLAHSPTRRWRVTAWYANGPFSYFYEGKSRQLKNLSPMLWLESDFMVLYVNQWQQEFPSDEKLAWFWQQEPAHIVQQNGLELVRIYDLRHAPLPDYLDLNNERQADFGGQIRLSAYRLQQDEAQPGEAFRVTFYERSLAPMEINYNVLVRLVAADGSELWRHDAWPYGAPTSNWPVYDHRPDGHEIVIPEEATAALYALTLSFYNPTTLEPLSVTEINSETSTGELERVIDFIRIGSPPNAARTLEPAPQFDSVALLKGVTLPESVEKGSTLNMALEWQSVAHTPHDYTVFVHLVAPDGTLVAQQDKQPLNGFAPTHLWDAGESFLDEVKLQIPAEIAPGTDYQLRVGFYTAESGRLPVTLAGQEAGDFVTIGSVSIR